MRSEEGEGFRKEGDGGEGEKKGKEDAQKVLRCTPRRSLGTKLLAQRSSINPSTACLAVDSVGPGFSQEALAVASTRYRKFRYCLAPPSMRNLRSSFLATAMAFHVFSWTFNRFQFQSLSIVFQSFSMTFSHLNLATRTQELIDNRKVGENSTLASRCLS